ncbi:Uu.00g002230.m01.CDS01 [Anthostomella pinea]|uniref:Uu.00g002230.m01.CDS01 n=1 Tax=Anthostomella pinea TaxID=933095 RepID=A0AAI8YIQ6_9PEZI|nr:Uu.00g002230.m01.CDS01 [Anthostomella pinea]
MAPDTQKREILSFAAYLLVSSGVLLYTLQGLYSDLYSPMIRASHHHVIFAALNVAALHTALLASVPCCIVVDRMKPRRSLPFLGGSVASLAYFVPVASRGFPDGKDIVIAALPFLVGFVLECMTGRLHVIANRLDGVLPYVLKTQDAGRDSTIADYPAARLSGEHVVRHCCYEARFRRYRNWSVVSKS